MFKKLSPTLLILCLTACEKPAVIEAIEVKSPVPVKGEVSLVQVRPENAPPRRLTIASATTSAQLTVPQTLTNRVKVTLDYVETRNLPAGPAGRAASIEAEFTVKGNDKGVFQAAAVDTKAGLVKKNGDGDREFEHPVNCNNRFKVSGSGRKLTIELAGFTGLASCQGDRQSRSDPHRPGPRRHADRRRQALEERLQARGGSRARPRGGQRARRHQPLAHRARHASDLGLRERPHEPHRRQLG
jgi:hypothetical protein